MPVHALVYVLIALNVICLVAFQWGRMAYFRRSENDGVRGGLGPLGTVFAVIQLPLVWIGSQQSRLALQILAALLYTLALAIFFWAVRSHQNNRPGIAFSSQTPAVVITDGAYQLARHPFYLAYMLFWVGAAIVAPFCLGVAFFAIMATLYARAALQEERDIMASPLAPVYAEYKSRVGMFFRWPRFD